MTSGLISIRFTADTDDKDLKRSPGILLFTSSLPIVRRRKSCVTPVFQRCLQQTNRAINFNNFWTRISIPATVFYVMRKFSDVVLLALEVLKQPR